MLEIALSGTNGTSAQTTYGEYISNTHAGTTSTNVGLYATASGGTTANYAAIFAAGNVGIGTTTPNALLDIGSAGATLGTLQLEGNTSGYVQIHPAAAAGSWTMTLPPSAGTSGYVLSTNGAGVTSWVSQGLASGTALAAPLITGVFAPNLNWQSYSLSCEIAAYSIINSASSFKIKMYFTAGSPVISAIKVKRTNPFSTTVVDTTGVTIGGASYPLTLSSPGLVTSDTINLPFSPSYDYYLNITFTGDAANGSVGVAQSGLPYYNYSSCIANNSGTDYTAASTMPALGGNTELFLNAVAP